MRYVGHERVPSPPISAPILVIPAMLLATAFGRCGIAVSGNVAALLRVARLYDEVSI